MNDAERVYYHEMLNAVEKGLKNILKQNLEHYRRYHKDE